MTNLKTRAQELLSSEDLRGRVPEEVQRFLREVAALEPVAFVRHTDFYDEGCEDWGLWCIESKTYSIPIYTLEPPMTPREAAKYIEDN